MQRMESAQLDPSTVQMRLMVARGLLRRSHGPEPVWPVVAAAAFFMVCALGFAAATITAPPGKRAPTPTAAKFTPVTEDAASKIR